MERLRFYFPFSIEGRVRVVKAPTLWALLRSPVIAEADEGLLTPAQHRWLKHIVKVDFERNATDGWELCRVSELMGGLPSVAVRLRARGRFRAVVRELKARAKNKVYVFGTGPSLARAVERDFSDGHVVVCNTIVRDPQLWHHLKPDLIAAGDAIYHFGHTLHARTFREDLKARLLESQGRTWFVYPEWFHGIVRREFADVADCLIPVPAGGHRSAVVNLERRFELPGLSNVLTVLLFPLGCTLSKSVWLWGFDGRAPDDKLFWANSSRHAYPELMHHLQEDHPAFFRTFVPKGKEAEYAKNVHGDELDRQLSAAEANGFRFVMMHRSWTETFNKRVLGGVGEG